ncbi:hypothetical protein ACA910_010884 [Epithemia clementina (nom. ined.)]
MTNLFVVLLMLCANGAIASLIDSAFPRSHEGGGLPDNHPDDLMRKRNCRGIRGKTEKSCKVRNSCPKKVRAFSGDWAKHSKRNFNRIATFPVCKLLDPNCNTDDEVVSEIIDVTADGKLLAFTDSTGRGLGLVDISDPSRPRGIGFFGVANGGEPKAVRILGNKWALLAVNTSPDFVNPSGYLEIIDLRSSPPTTYHTINLGGQPDAVAISPDEKYVAIAIENERDEDFGDGGLPQLPPGFLVILDSHESDPKNWVLNKIVLTGLDGLVAPEDPEPEYVDFNSMNEVVVTLQENNAIVIVDAKTKTIKKSFTAGSLDLENIDAVEEDIINQCGTLKGVLREPDGVAWVDKNYFFTADEGDWNGGSRSITLFDKFGKAPPRSSGPLLDHIAAAYGHYPEDRSENKGNEPETVYVQSFGKTKYLFTLSERSGLVFVSELDKNSFPWFIQALPAGFRPEGIVAVPSRDLLIVASEEDDRGSVYRASLSIYKYMNKEPAYPQIISAATTCEENGSVIPIPFAALSGLAVDPGCSFVLYSIEDSFYKSNRFFKIDTSQKPAVLYEAKRLMDAGKVLQDFAKACGCFDENPVNDDFSVNVDSEGISVFDNGIILVASEGDTRSGRRKPSFVMGLSPDGEIVDVWTLPDEWNAKAKRWGFEGIAIDPGQEMVVVAGQVAWGPCKGSASPNSSPSGCTGDDPGPALHIFMNGVWSGYVYYPLDEPSSPNGGWVGIGDLSPLGNKKFAVLERDNQGGLDASIKKVYTIDLNDWYDGKIAPKKLWKNLLPDLAAANGAIPEKTEGLACVNGGCWVNNDNDGLDENSGENQLIFVSPDLAM